MNRQVWDGPADVTVDRREIPWPIDGPAEFAAAGDGVLLTIPDVARYWIADGNTIAVEPADGAEERNLRLYLLGSAFGVLIHQRGLLPLHANAVEIGGRAVAFLGASGSGKSTLAAWFHDNGYRLLADDVCVVGFDESGEPLVRPGMPRMRLWRDALEASGRDPGNFPNSYAGDPTYDKFDVAVASSAAITEKFQLAAIYHLDTGDLFEIEPLAGISAATILFENTYRGQFVTAAGQPVAHFQACTRLANSTPVFRCRRRWGTQYLRDQAALIARHASELAGA